MTQENVVLVRRLLECFIAGEVLWDALDEAVEIHDHDILDAGEYRGHAGVMRWVEDWGAGLPVVSFDLQELIDAGDVVVAVILLKARGRDSSVDVERQDAIVYQFRHGRVARFDYYNSRQQALEAVGPAD
jgi:ketosteroid isomerase-like protein